MVRETNFKEKHKSFSSC